MTEIALKGIRQNISMHCQLCTEREPVPGALALSGVTVSAKVVDGEVDCRFSLVAQDNWDMSENGELRLYIPEFLYSPAFLLDERYQMFPVSANVHARIGTSSMATVRRPGEVMLLADSEGRQYLRFWILDVFNVQRGLVAVTFEDPSPWEAGDKPSRLIGGIRWELA
jgi:hypothetical protein